MWCLVKVKLDCACTCHIDLVLVDNQFVLILLICISFIVNDTVKINIEVNISYWNRQLIKWNCQTLCWIIFITDEAICDNICYSIGSIQELKIFLKIFFIDSSYYWYVCNSNNNIFIDKHKENDVITYAGSHYFVIKQKEHFNNT